MAALWEATHAYRKALEAAETPGQAAHDAWCADHDWDELSDEEREGWEDAGHAARAWKPPVLEPEAITIITTKEN
jgi:hypothetical protein